MPEPNYRVIDPDTLLVGRQGAESLVSGAAVTVALIAAFFKYIF